MNFITSSETMLNDTHKERRFDRCDRIENTKQIILDSNVSLFNLRHMPNQVGVVYHIVLDFEILDRWSHYHILINERRQSLNYR